MVDVTYFLSSSYISRIIWISAKLVFFIPFAYKPYRITNIYIVQLHLFLIVSICVCFIIPWYICELAYRSTLYILTMYLLFSCKLHKAISHTLCSVVLILLSFLFVYILHYCVTILISMLKPWKKIISLLRRILRDLNKLKKPTVCRYASTSYHHCVSVVANYLSISGCIKNLFPLKFSIMINLSILFHDFFLFSKLL